MARKKNDWRKVPGAARAADDVGQMLLVDLELHSQTEMAERLGVTQPEVSLFVNTGRMGVQMFIKLYDHYVGFR